MLLLHEIWNSIFAFLCLPDVCQFAHTSKLCYDVAQRYITYRRRLLTKPFFDNPDEIFRILAACNAVISGSSVLYLLLPERDILWKPGDLDIYVCDKDLELLLRNLGSCGYQVSTTEYGTDDPYPYSHIQKIFTLHHQKSKIDVIVSKTSTPISPIFQYHSTVVMNFLTANSLFCAYPELTLQKKSIINPFAVYGQALKRTTLQALLKYNKRGIQYTSCRHLHGNSQCWKERLRSVDDELGLWIRNPSPETFPATQDFHTLKWSLGGSICNRLPAYAPPYILINNTTT